LEDIGRETDLANLPVDYRVFDNRFENDLPADTTTDLPDKYKKSKIINFYQNYRQALIDLKFLDDFANQELSALLFAKTNPNVVLQYRKSSPNGTTNSGAEAGQIWLKD